MRLIALVSVAVLFTSSLTLHAWGQAPTAVSRTADRKQVVTTVVTEFGRRLRMVALLAPKEQMTKSMDEAYSGLVAAGLLATWKSNPEKAPGKRTSSPSPERIDISSITTKGHDAYVVKGKVILLTAQERREGGVFQANPVTMTVSQQNGRWVITAFEEKEALP
jgi:hypothetical protein